jgi:hypothetical protein
MPNTKTPVKTNTTPNSIKEVELNAVTFRTLWDNYATGNPYDDPTGEYRNQCAIRMSVTLHRVGIEMKSFSQKLVKPAPGKQTIRRILIGGKATATRADEMADWLKLKPFTGLQKPENVTGSDWKFRISGRTGIIAFKNYWRRDGERDASGGHIDLWNGSRITISGPASLVGSVGRSLGIESAHVPGTDIGYSDLSKATEILFWEIR